MPEGMGNGAQFELPLEPGNSRQSRKNKLTKALILGGMMAVGAVGGREIFERRPVAIGDFSLDLEDVNKLPEEAPALVLQHANSIEKRRDGRELIERAAWTHPELALSQAASYASYLDPKELERIIINSAFQEEGKAFQKFAHEAGKVPEGQEILKSVIKAAVDKHDARFLLKNAKTYSHLPDAINIVRKAVEMADLMTRVEYVEEYKELPIEEVYAKEAFAWAAEHAPTLFFENLQPFSRAAWAGKLIQQALEKDYLSALFYLKKDSSLPDAERITRYAIQKIRDEGYGEFLLGCMECWDHLPDSEEILREIVANGQDYALAEQGKFLAGKPWARERLEQAYLQSSREALEQYEVYKDWPSSERIIKNAVEDLARQNDWYLLLEHSHAYANTSWGREVFKTVLGEIEPDGIVVRFEYYKHLDTAEATFKEAAQKASIANILQVGLYLSQYDWGRDLVEKAAGQDMDSALSNAINIRWLPEYPNLMRKAAENNMQKQPRLVMQQAPFLDSIGRGWLEGVIEKTAEHSAGDALIEAQSYAFLPNSREIVLKAEKEAAKTEPFTMLGAFERYSSIASDPEMVKSAALNLAKDNPGSLIELMQGDSGSYLAQEPWAKDACEQAVFNKPQLLARVIRGSHISNLLEQSANPQIRKASEFLKEEAVRGEAAVGGILVAFIDPSKPVAEIKALVRDRPTLLSFLLQAVDSGKSAAMHEAKEFLETLVLKSIRNINNLHDSPDEVRFESIENAGPEELYVMLVYGEEELFTSSFNGIFSRMLDRMKDKKMSGEELLERMDNVSFRTFIKMASQFNRLNDFLETMSKKASDKILMDFVSSIEKEEDPLKEAVAVADTFSVIRDQEMLRVLQATIRAEYERVSAEDDQKGKAMYGLLSGMFADKAVINSEWLQAMAEKYRLPDVISLDNKDLLNSGGVNVQEYFFYNDADGQASFESFMSRYEDKAEWRIEDKGTFVHIISKVDRNHPNKVEIFANKPKSEGRGNIEIEKVLSERKLKSVVIVHRGHSYHAQDTIRKIPSIARLVFLGSCGGYNNLHEVLEKAPKAHILSTKGTGTMFVNDPLLGMINSDIRAGKDIHWEEFWAKAELTLGGNDNFNNYVPPNRNLGAIFIKAYQQALKSGN